MQEMNRECAVTLHCYSGREMGKPVECPLLRAYWPRKTVTSILTLRSGIPISHNALNL